MRYRFKGIKTSIDVPMSDLPSVTAARLRIPEADIKDFEDVVKLDLKYIDEWSLLLDMKLIFMTIGTVILRKGAK